MFTKQMKRILLLDCSSRIKKSLQQKGFIVTSGSQGFSTGIREIPVPYYEQDLIVYDLKNISAAKPHKAVEREGTFYIPGITTNSQRPEGKDIHDFLRFGGILLVFANDIDDDIQRTQAYYSWIPNMPHIFPTNDSILSKGRDTDEPEYKPYSSIFRYFKPKIPVKRRLAYPDSFRAANNYLENVRGDILSANRRYDYDKGVVLILPQYDSNDDVIMHFCTYVFPLLVDFKPDLPSYLKVGKSQKIQELEEKISKQKDTIDRELATSDELQSQLNDTLNKTEQAFSTDETAVLIRGYLETVVEDKEVSWFYAYKIIERLYKHYGSEIKTKETLGLREEFNFIKDISNKSGRDTRHPPRPGENPNPPSDEENERISNDSIAIVSKYLESIAP